MRIKTLIILAFVSACFANQILATDSVTNDTLVLSANGKEAIAREDYSLVIGIYSKVLQLDSNNADAYYARGWAQVQKRQFDDAIADLSKAITYYSNNISLSYAFLSRGSANVEKNNLKQAIADYRKAIQLNPAFTEAYIARGRAYALSERYDDSILDCSMAIELNPIFAEAFYWRGMANIHNGNLNEALTDFDKAIQLDKTNAIIYLQRAVVKVSKGNYLAAIADCDTAIEYCPTNVDAYSTRGFIYSKTGEFIKGIEDCKKGVLLDTNNFEANNNLAWLLAIAPDAKLRDGQKALEYAKRACQLTDWKNAYCLGTLAAAYAEMGNFDEAVKWEKKCISIGLPEKEMPQAHKALGLFEQKKPYHAEK